MKKVVMIYGLIAGAIVAGMMLITMPLYNSGTLNMDNGEWVGYSTMVVALSMVFFGIKSYRDNYLNGVISFWSATKVGILITVIASVMYALAWEICYANFGDEFTQKMVEGQIEKVKTGGGSDAELQKAREDWAKFSEMYKNPAIRFGVTLMEIFPVGLLITLLSGGLLRNKKFLQAAIDQSVENKKLTSNMKNGTPLLLMLAVLGCTPSTDKTAVQKQIVINDTTPRVTGIGGIFFCAKNPKEVREWYGKNLGMAIDDYGSPFEFRNANRPEEINYLRWSPFQEGSDYLQPSEKEFMINYRVYNLEAMVRKLQANGVTLLDSIQTVDYGKFVHLMDSEGNKIELWEPIDSVLTKMGAVTTK